MLVLVYGLALWLAARKVDRTQRLIAHVLTIPSQMIHIGYAKSDHTSYLASKSERNKVMQELATGVCSSGISVIVADSDCVAMDLGGAEVKLTPKKRAPAGS